MKRKEKLKLLGLLMKSFSVATYVMTWYAEASKDDIINKEELAQLGLGICDVLGLKTDINLPTVEESKEWS